MWTLVLLLVTFEFPLALNAAAMGSDSISDYERLRQRVSRESMITTTIMNSVNVVQLELSTMITEQKQQNDDIKLLMQQVAALSKLNTQLNFELNKVKQNLTESNQRLKDMIDQNDDKAEEKSGSLARDVGDVRKEISRQNNDIEVLQVDLKQLQRSTVDDRVFVDKVSSISQEMGEIKTANGMNSLVIEELQQEVNKVKLSKVSNDDFNEKYSRLEEELDYVREHGVNNSIAISEIEDEMDTITFNQTKHDNNLLYLNQKVQTLQRRSDKLESGIINMTDDMTSFDSSTKGMTTVISEMQGDLSLVQKSSADLGEIVLRLTNDPTTGKFKAQVSGTYVFFFNILTRPHMRLGVDLTINGETRSACAYSGADPNFSVNGSNMVVVHLNQGDEVWVRAHKSRDPPPGVMLSSFANSFAGFLLYSD
uniref:C1q domain-containing protein n=1 Tax=Magallana gigas TaxID=29159 RepID=A0A8W8NWV4_MAGGI